MKCLTAVDEDGSLVDTLVVGSNDLWELLSFGGGVEPGSVNENASGIELRVAEK